MSEVAIAVVLLFVMYILFICLETCQEKYQCVFGHQASYILVIGMTISFILKKMHDEPNKITEMLAFNEEIFFYICLPPIVFASGFNMNRGNFFANIKIVAIFGVIGTLVSFSTFSFMTAKMVEYMEMDVYDGSTDKWSLLSMDTREIILMSSLLCSSDVIAAVSLVNQEKEPRLFSIIFGEGITNDAVSIILFNTVLRYTIKNEKITYSTPFSITGGFLMLGLISVAIGAVFGFLSALFMKTFRSLTHNAINQAVILLCFAYISYTVSELFHESGIISLLMCGIVQAHYAYYNLSTMGQHASYVIYQFISFFMEAFVFIYLGTSFFSFSHYRWCPKLIIVQIFVIMIGRFIAVVGLLLFLKICKYDSKLSFKQQIFVWFAGMIRGAIAFGLVLKIKKTQFPNADIIATTTLVLVIFTTVFFGSVLGLLQKCLFGGDEKVSAGEGNEEKMLTEEQQKEAHGEEKMEHYNQGETVDTLNEEGCGVKFAQFDKKHIKPIFVHEYSVEMQNEVDNLDRELVRARARQDSKAMISVLGDILKEKVAAEKKEEEE